MSASDPCHESRRLLRIDAAFKAGDLAALRAELDDDDDRFPNVVVADSIGDCLTYAIYHSPVAFIAELLDLGADPNWPADDGFPPLIAALACGRSSPGSPARSDVHAIVELLLARIRCPAARAERLHTAPLGRGRRRPGDGRSAARARRRPERDHAHR